MNSLFYSSDVEKYIIGALIIEKHDDVHMIDEFDFYLSEYKMLFKIVKWMKETNKQIDYLSVSELAKKKIDNALDKVIECISSVITLANFEHHFGNLKMYSTKRQIQSKIGIINTLLHDSKHDISEELKSDALQILSEVKTPLKDNTSKKLVTIVEDTKLQMMKESQIEQDFKLYTGFKKLDNLMAGLHEQELTILAARPGMGKTAFALNLMINLAKKGNKCLFVSREMSNMQISKRILSILATVDSNKLRMPKALKDEDWRSIDKGILNNKTILENITIDDETYHVQGIRSQVRTMQIQSACDILFVDYLGLVKTLKKCESRRLEIEDVSWSLKQIGKEFKIPVICLCQLNRDVSQIRNEEPQLHHLRESGAIEQDADNVLMLHEPDESENPFANVEPDKKLTKVLIRKQRNGPVGQISLLCYKSTFKYYNVD